MRDFNTISVEPAQTAREDVGRAMGAIASEIASGRSWADRITREERDRQGVGITVWGA